MYATLRPCEVKDVRYAARAVKDVRFTASRVQLSRVRICQSFGSIRFVYPSAYEGREGGVRRREGKYMVVCSATA